MLIYKGGQPLDFAKYVSHHPDEFQSAQIANAVINSVRVLACSQNALVAQYRKMLRNIALGCAYLIYDLLDADLLIAQHTQYFKPQRMRDSLDGLCG